MIERATFSDELLAVIWRLRSLGERVPRRVDAYELAQDLRRLADEIERAARVISE